MDSAADTPRGVGCPIRKSSDQRSLPSPRSLSQGATSFIASRCQGIHQMPFLSLENVTRSAMRRDKPTHTADPLMRNTTDVTFAKPDPSVPPTAKRPSLSRRRLGTSPARNRPKAWPKPTPVLAPETKTSSRCPRRNPKTRRPLPTPAPPAAPAARANPAPNPCFHHRKQRTGERLSAPPGAAAEPGSSKPACSGPLGAGVVEPDGVEPTTSCVQSRRSPN